MRKTMILIAILMCACVNSFGQSNGLPQWKVVFTKHISKGADQILNVPFFTPKTSGLYRLTVYMTALGSDNQSGWNAALNWTDSNGASTDFDFSATNGQARIAQELVFALSPKPNTPITLNNVPFGQTGTYSLAIVIEKLTR